MTSKNRFVKRMSRFNQRFVMPLIPHWIKIYKTYETFFGFSLKKHNNIGYVILDCGRLIKINYSGYNLIIDILSNFSKEKSSNEIYDLLKPSFIKTDKPDKYNGYRIYKVYLSKYPYERYVGIIEKIGVLSSTNYNQLIKNINNEIVKRVVNTISND